MKKNNQETTLLREEVSSNKNLEIDKIKTTNVNILLNRVKLDKKRTFKKRILFSFFLVTAISSLTVYFII